MAPRAEGSHLKRNRVPGSPADDDEQDSFKKPRRSMRISKRTGHDDDLKTPVQNRNHLPSPLTNVASETATEFDKEATATPPQDRPSQAARRRADDPHSQSQGIAFSSPPQDTQAFSQQLDIDPNAPLVEGVDELKDGVWGYLLPLGSTDLRAPVVLKNKLLAPPPTSSAEPLATTPIAGNGSARGRQRTPAGDRAQDDKSPAALGYIIGRHPECDVRVNDAQVSNRHCLIFSENKGDSSVAVLEDLSTNGTYVNDAYLKRNDRRELQEGDEISVATSRSCDFIFRYPRRRHGATFAQQYTMKQALGSGHFAQVFMCNEKSTGEAYAVKKFAKNPANEEKTKYDSLHQEVAMLTGISHPNILSLKETFNEPEAVYMVLELAPKGELFHYISRKSKMSEADSRKVFLQLFDGIKYLHDRNMVHRDIKPENILIMDDDLTVKIADFGLAKIVGEASFTTTLCGTPSYVAPEILASSKSRKYTKAVDIWSLGVVLYICLCGFPPFSDELNRSDFPYTLSEQIRKGLFDYPSPYWDPVGDPALDLIDSMLVTEPDRRFTVAQCLAHSWLTQKPAGLNDSTNGLVSGLAGLEMSRRAAYRERTLISSVNPVHVTDRVPAGAGKPEVVVYSKKGGAAAAANNNNGKREDRPDEARDPGEFMHLGGKGDQQLFPDAGPSSAPSSAPSPARDVGKGEGKGGKGKGKAKAKGKGGR